jgi:ankyrin repeat protein
MASWGQHAEIVRLLIAYGADGNARDEKGRTALHETLKDQLQMGIVETLVKHGALVDMHAMSEAASHRLAKFLVPLLARAPKIQ